MPYKCHMPTLLKVHIWGKYVNIYVIYEVTLINGVARKRLYTDNDDAKTNITDDDAEQ